MAIKTIITETNNFEKLLDELMKEDMNFFNRYLKSGHWAQLMKSNTTPVFTMIELYKLTKNEISICLKLLMPEIKILIA